MSRPPPKRAIAEVAPARRQHEDLFASLAARQPETEANRKLREAVEAAGVVAKPRGARKPRPFSLTPPKPKERPEQRAMVRHLNMVVANGFCFHVVNEGLWSFMDMAIKNRAERMKVIGKLKQAMLKDGFVPRFPDNVLFWPLPERWREILEAAGETVPERMAFAGAIEAKRPGWTPSGDKEWRESRDQLYVLECLKRAGVPFAVARSAEEAVEAARAMGAPVRGFGGNAAGGDQRSDVADPPKA